jgi:gluconate 5-dehydrogenase
VRDLTSQHSSGHPGNHSPERPKIHPLFDLTGQTALITGSGQGTGLSPALGLASTGAQIVLNSRNAARLTAAAQTLHDAGTTARLRPFDVTDHAAVRSAVDGFEAAEGPISILVTNARIQRRTPLKDFAHEDFELLLQTNIPGVFHPAQAVARHMIKRGTGRIISVASIQTALAPGYFDPPINAALVADPEFTA